MSMRMQGRFNFEALNARIDAALPDALQAGMEHIAEISAQQVPIEEGTLLRSQKVTVHPERSEVSLSYGTPYARYQHEVLELRHEHGNAKFLELPLIAHARTAFGIIARHLRRHI